MLGNDKISIAGIAKANGWVRQTDDPAKPEPEKSRVFRILRRLKRLALVEQSRGTSKYYLTDKGVAAAREAGDVAGVTPVMSSARRSRTGTNIGTPSGKRSTYTGRSTRNVRRNGDMK